MGVGQLWRLENVIALRRNQLATKQFITKLEFAISNQPWRMKFFP